MSDSKFTNFGKACFLSHVSKEPVSHKFSPLNLKLKNEPLNIGYVITRIDGIWYFTIEAKNVNVSSSSLPDLLEYITENKLVNDPMKYLV